jgi:uncharacterized membrane protein
MSELVVVGFKGDKSRASDALNKLRDLDFRWVIDLEGAVAMYRDDDGKLHLRQDPEMTTGEGVRWGGVIGSLLGAILAVPFTGGASAAAAVATLVGGAVSGTAAGAAFGAVDASWKKDYGINSTFIGDVAALVQPGNSAIFALIDTSEPDVVAAEFEGYGGTVLRSSLTPKQIAALEDYLHDRRAEWEGKTPAPS